MRVVLRGVVRAAGRLVHPVSPLGWVVLVLAAALGAGGWRLGWVELTVVAAAAGAALLAALVLTVGRSTFAVDLDMSDHRVTVGERAVGRLAVRNTSRRRLLPAQIVLPVGQGSADFHLPSLGPGATFEDVFAVPTTRRAVVVVGPVLSVRGDPLGLMRRKVRWAGPVDLYVHPRLVSLAGAASGVLRDLEGQATRTVSDSDMSFHALRDYVAGDDRRHIHWRSSAKIGALMVRQFEDTRRTHTAVALSTATGDYATDGEFELAVGVAASVGVQALRDERDLTVLAGDAQLRTDTPPRLLDDCSGLEASSGGVGADHLARRVAREAPDASVAILVVGSVPTRATMRAHAVHIPVGVRTLVLLCCEGAPVEVVQHGTLSLASIGSLADLPRVLRRVVAG
ncbi:DUF58 domain-containing protein [Actinotalea sp. K2]|uniref:DUF58 domain-containing protein n=1 Tax=Actinotalea sp. K2 TaxID=2939438 RepID=UPI0020182639|nr:DUF58 domain-containing protein [Actinotalea sp. K2]MCL3863201.1 DUF58 domain-containing protein [Actinotalea sp. K2]